MAVSGKKKRGLRLALKITAALLGLLLTLVAALLIWLRTEQAERFLAGLLTEQLAGQGLYLKMAEFTGPLPGRFYVRGLELADKDGVWFSLDELELRLSLRSLLLRRLEVEKLRVAEPSLFRLPELPPSPPAETAARDDGGGLSLPVSIRLTNVNISDGHIGPGILEMLGQIAPDSPDGQSDVRRLTLPRLSLNVSGDAALSRRGISADLNASALHDDGSGFNLSLYTGPLSPAEIAALRRAFMQEPGPAQTPEQTPEQTRDDQDSGDLGPELPDEGGETALWPLFIQGHDYLRLEITAREARGGMLAFLSGRADFPAYSLSLAGLGTPQDWRGLLSLKVENLLEIDGGFEFASASDAINFENILDDRLSAGLRLRGKALDGLPVEVRAAASPQVALEAAARWDGDKGFLDLLSLESEGWLAALRSFEFNDTGDQLRLRGRLHTRLDEKGLGKFLGETPPLAGQVAQSALPPLPVNNTVIASGQDSLTTDTDFDVTIGRAPAPENEPGRAVKLVLTGRAAAGFQGAELPLAYSLNGEFAKNYLHLPEFSLQGLGLSLAGDGDYSLELGKARANLRLTSRSDAPWRPWLENMLQAPDSLPGGDIELSAQLESNELSPSEAPGAGSGGASRADLDLRGRGMIWPAWVPDGLLGPDLDVQFDFSGSARRAYTFSIGKFESGAVNLTGGGKMAAPLSQPNLDAALTLRLAALEPLLAGSGFSEVPADAARPPQTADGYTWPNGEPLPNRLAGQSGAILEAAVNGPLARPNLDLLLQLTDLRLPSNNILGSPSLRISTRRQPIQPSQAVQAGLNGQVELTAVQRPGGPLSLTGDWAFNPAEAGGLSAALRHLTATANGLTLLADLHLKMPDNAPPRLEGGGQLNIENWRTIDAFTGARLSGDPAVLDFRLEPSTEAQLGQRLTANWKMGRLIMYRAGEGAQGLQSRAFDLESLEGRLDVTRLFQLPGVQLEARAGRGGAGGLRWRSGRAEISTERDNGKFEAALYGGRAPGAPGDGSPGQSGKKGQRDGRAGESSDKGGKSSANGRRGSASAGADSGSELVLLGGVFDLSIPSLRLEKFELHSFDRSHSVSLADPAVFDFRRGLQVQELKLNLSSQASGEVLLTRRGADAAPAVQIRRGSLTASADIADGDARLRANVKNLPFQIAKIFTTDALPEGQLSLDLNLDKQGGRLRGEITAEAAFYPTSQALLTAVAAADANKELADKAAVRQNMADTPLLIDLRAHFDENPADILPRARLTRLPGVTRLIAHGNINYAAAPAGSRDGSIDIDLPLRVGQDLLPVLDTQAPLAARVQWQGPLAALWRLVPAADLEISGYGSIDLGLFGNVTDPLYWGRAYLVDGRYEDKILGLLLDDITLEAKGNSRRLDLLLSAGDGGEGSLSVQGALHSAADDGEAGRNGRRRGGPSLISSAEPPHLTLRGQIRSLSPVHRDDLTLQFSGIFGARGPLSELDLSAKIDVERAEYQLLSGVGGSVTTLEITDPTAEIVQKQTGGHTIDAELNIPGRLYVRGFGLDSEWRGNLKASGPLSAPILTGRISPTRGYFDVFSKPFAFSGGGVIFAGGDKINPELDLDLTYNGPNITAIIQIYGTANKPRFRLDSRPPMPQDQILSQVLFGKNADSLSNFEAIQLANGLRVLAGDNGPGFLGSVRDTLGVDMLRISSGRDGSQQRNTYGTIDAASMGQSSAGGSSEDESIPRLEAGKYISDSIYVGFEQGVTEDSSSVRVEVELRPNLTLRGRSGTQSSEVGLGWKMDY